MLMVSYIYSGSISIPWYIVAPIFAVVAMAGLTWWAMKSKGFKNHDDE
jgi:hypothetical protein